MPMKMFGYRASHSRALLVMMTAGSLAACGRGGNDNQRVAAAVAAAAAGAAPLYCSRGAPRSPHRRQPTTCAWSSSTLALAAPDLLTRPRRLRASVSKSGCPKSPTGTVAVMPQAMVASVGLRKASPPHWAGMVSQTTDAEHLRLPVQKVRWPLRKTWVTRIQQAAVLGP